MYKLTASSHRRVYFKIKIMDNFIGKKYKLKSSDNFEDYLKFIGECLVIFLSYYIFNYSCNLSSYLYQK